MVISLSQHFTWPGLGKDARAYCSACPECQRSGRQLQLKAPLVPTPIIGVPYQRLACDLVDLLPKTKSGYRYILTVMCLGTRWGDYT